MDLLKLVAAKPMRHNEAPNPPPPSMEDFALGRFCLYNNENGRHRKTLLLKLCQLHKK